jgi:hypothetical protein
MSNTINGAELVTAVLDDLDRSGTIANWSRRTTHMPGNGSSRTVDLYEITFGPKADADDRQGVEAFLLRHGRTGHGHEVEVRVLGSGDTPGTFHA